MKALKNPLIALILCAAIILTSTCLNAKIGLEKRYDKICDRIYSEILEYSYFFFRIEDVLYGVIADHIARMVAESENGRFTA